VFLCQFCPAHLPSVLGVVGKGNDGEKKEKIDGTPKTQTMNCSIKELQFMDR